MQGRNEFMYNMRSTICYHAENLLMVLLLVFFCLPVEYRILKLNWAMLSKTETVSQRSFGIWDAQMYFRNANMYLLPSVQKDKLSLGG